jgi:uncharacterized membrane protein YuzA (DUF378 family)
MRSYESIQTAIIYRVVGMSACEQCTDKSKKEIKTARIDKESRSGNGSRLFFLSKSSF